MPGFLAQYRSDCLFCDLVADLPTVGPLNITASEESQLLRDADTRLLIALNKRLLGVGHGSVMSASDEIFEGHLAMEDYVAPRDESTPSEFR